MATELAKAYVQILPSAKGITANLANELKPLEKAGDEAGKKAGTNFGKSFQKATGQTLDQFGKKALVGAAALGVGLFGVAKAAGNLQAAIAANEQVLGDASAAVQTWAKDSIANLGLSERATLEAATAFGQLAKVAGLTGNDVAEFSKRFVVLAADMAAFKDVPVQQALEDLQSGFAGQTEVMRKYGVFLDEASLKAAYFQETGEKVTGTLTAQQRVLATQSAILAASGDIQGQAAREADGFARAQDNFRATLENTAATIGSSVLPAMTGLLAGATKLVGGFARVDEATNGVVGRLALFATAGVGAVGTAALVASKVNGLVTTFRKLSAAGKIATVGMGILAGAAIAFSIHASRAAERTRELAEAIDSANRATDDQIIQSYSEAVNRAFVETHDFGEAQAQVAREAYGAAVRILALEDATGALTKQNLAWGLTSEQAAAQVEALRTAVANEAKAQEAAASSAKAASDGIDGVADSSEAAGAAVAGAAVGVSALGSAAENARGYLFGAAAGAAALEEEADPTIEVMSDLDRAFAAASDHASEFARNLDGVFGSATDLQAAADTTKDNVEALSQSLKDNGKTLDENTDKGRANREQVRQSVDGIKAYALGMVEAGKTNDEVAYTVTALRGQLVQQMTQFGLTEDQAAAYVDQLGLTPESVSTAVEFTGDTEAKARVQAVIDKMGGIPPNITTIVQASIDRGAYELAERQLEQLAKNRLVALRVQISGGGSTTSSIKPVATGGYFAGGSDRGQLHTLAELAGPRGDEVVLPLGDPHRMSSLLAMPEVFGRVLSAMPAVTAGVTAGNTAAGGDTAIVQNYGETVTVGTVSRALRMARTT